jgi:hypothetical protein
MTKVGVRLRQAVLVAAELEPAVERLRAELGLGEPYADPGVGAFGLVNAVMAVGDCFVEVVSPARPGTTAGRYLERHGGDGGYMLIFQLDDLEGARERAASMGIRTVWRLDLADISGTHMHPADMRGAIVSLDDADPPGSWRWAGPEWTGRGGPRAPGRLLGVGLEVGDPGAVAARWAELLGLDEPPRDDGAGAKLRVDGAEVRFTPAGEAGSERLVEIGLAVAPEVRARRDAVELCGVRFRLEDDEAGGETGG